MNVIIAKDYDEMSKKAAEVLLDVVKNTENMTISYFFPGCFMREF